MSKHFHLPLRTITVETPRPTRTRAARTTPTKGRNLAAELVHDFQIGVQDMMMVYMSPDPYHDAFKQSVDLWKFDLTKHATGGLSLYMRDGRVHLASIAPSTPAARIHSWQTRIQVRGLSRLTVVLSNPSMMLFGPLTDCAHPVLLRLRYYSPILKSDPTSHKMGSQLCHRLRSPNIHMTNSTIDGSSQQWRRIYDHAGHRTNTCVQVMSSMWLQG